MSSIKETMTLALGLLVAFGIIAHCTACGSDAKAPTSEQVAAEGAYGASLLRCVDEARTLPESKACRARVDAEFGVTQTGRDGGK